jgi:hypothetical protein
MPVAPQPIAPAPVPKKVPDQRVNTVWEKVRPPKATKPRTIKTLTSHIKAMFPNAITDSEVANIIVELRSRKFISITDSKITYNV